MGMGAAWRQALSCEPLEWFWRMLTYWECRRFCQEAALSPLQGRPAAGVPVPLFEQLMAARIGHLLARYLCYAKAEDKCRSEELGSVPSS